MDKFEALRSKKRVLDTRRYGDISELMALLKHVGATVLKLDVTHKKHHMFLPSMTPITSLEEAADSLISQHVDIILLHWDEPAYQHYCTVALVASGRVWSARPAVQHALRDLVQNSKLVHALTLSPARARAACVSLLGSVCNDEPISFGTCWEVFQGKAEHFHVPRGENRFQYHATVTTKLHDIFPELRRDEVSHMVTMLQWFFGPEYLWFTPARLNDKAKFDVL